MHYIQYALAPLAAAVLFALAPSALAGPEWVEKKDAGNLPGGAQDTFGEGPLRRISGGLSPGFAGDDTEDMFLIRITARAIREGTFSVSTVGRGSASFDSQLWLFRYVIGGERQLGFGLLANDDAGDGRSGSFIGPASNDGSGARITEPGLYLLAITRFNNDPFADPGEIFFQKSREEISGPDGEGGQSPIVGWTGEGSPIWGDDGRYSIRLTGVRFAIPAPGALGLLAIAGLAGRCRRRIA